MQRVKIETAQNVFIEYLPASVGDRILATLIDDVITWSYLIGAFSILGNLNVDMGWGVISAVSLPFVLYHLVSEIFMDGQTVGKKARNIKVVKLDGSQPGVGDYLLRWLLRPIDVLLSGAVAIIVISSGGRGQRLGDLAAGTAVVDLNRRVGLTQTQMPTVPETYEPTYPQAITLSDRDVAIIKEVLHVHVHGDEPNPKLLNELFTKVQRLLQVESSQPPMAFLRTVLKDYTHLTGR